MIKESGGMVVPWVLSAQGLEHSPSIPILTACERRCIGELQPPQH